VRALESRVASRGEERRGGVVGGISGDGGRTKRGGEIEVEVGAFFGWKGLCIFISLLACPQNLV